MNHNVYLSYVYSAIAMQLLNFETTIANIYDSDVTLMHAGTLILSPSEVAYVCPEMNLTLNCSTYENQFLEWTIIVSQRSNSRLISATGIANQVQPLVINATHFHISRVSAENATMPLVSSMLITNALNNSVVNCSGIGTNGVKTETSTTRIYISGGGKIV